MADAALARMSATEFLDWCEGRPGHYELVEGEPRQMTGATRRHDLVVTNAIAAFRTRLRGGPCRPTTDDIAVFAANGNVRRPDMTVDCGPVDLSSMRSDRPVLVLEVLSPSTANTDKFEKVDEYKALNTIEYILIADATRVHVRVYQRAADRSWTPLNQIGRDAVIPLPALGCDLPLAELYEDVPDVA